MTEITALVAVQQTSRLENIHVLETLAFDIPVSSVNSLAVFCPSPRLPFFSINLGAFYLLQITNGAPKGVRTPVTDVRGQCPRPLDDGSRATDYKDPTNNSKYNQVNRQTAG